MHDDDIEGENGVRQATEGTNHLQHSASEEVTFHGENHNAGMRRVACYTQPQGRSELTERKNSYSDSYEI